MDLKTIELEREEFSARKRDKGYFFDKQTAKSFLAEKAKIYSIQLSECGYKVRIFYFDK